MTQSALYEGTVYHQRYRPTVHRFSYSIYLFWLKLDELDAVERDIKFFSCKRFSLAQFRRSDYLGNPDVPLEKSVIAKITELNGAPISGDVFMLGQLRMLGFYFSPVNFYFLRSGNNRFTHMLAEVSNTPWHEKHCYLVDLELQAEQAKEFHVSPFNPMEMIYKWRISQPQDSFSLSLDCYQEQRHFSAGVNLSKKPLSDQRLRQALWRIPSMSIKTLMGIYFQALRLWLKDTPVYSHPGSKENKK